MGASPAGYQGNLDWLCSALMSGSLRDSMQYLYLIHMFCSGTYPVIDREKRIMMNIKPHTLTALCTTLLLSALGASCAPGEDDELGHSEAKISIRFHDDGTGGGDAKNARARDAMEKAGEYTDVDRILIDVTYSSNGQPFLINFALTQLTPNEWEGTLPFLPANDPLTFAARAYDADDVEIFSGSSEATLTIDNQDVEIPLAPPQDDETYDMPRMFRIVYPTEIVATQEVPIIFTVEGNAGETISFDLTSDDGSSPFVPAQGSVTLTNTVADFITLYTAPDVASNTDLGHQVTITSDFSTSAVSIATGFVTTIVPQAAAQVGVVDTRPNVLFNPVVMNVIGQSDGTDVEWTAEVSDDSDPANLVYQWSYAPNAGSPAGSFASGGAGNPGVFENYLVEHQGVITLAVTDENGGTTTVNYNLVPDQFEPPEDPGAIDGVKRIVAGEAHTCVLTGDDTVRCWGDAQYGQLGYGNAQDIGDDAARLPFTAGDVALPVWDPVAQLVAGFNHTCARLQSGWVYCWGQNTYGQLGYATTDHLGDGEPVTSFGYVSLGGPARKIAAGGAHTCAILDNGALRCWGYNANGELGHGHTNNIGDDENVFDAGNVELGAGIEADDIFLGSNHTCALLTTGNIRCWGRNANGQLGYGSNQNIGDDEDLLSLGDVSLPGPVRAVAAGHSHTCALMDNGAMRCWGYQHYGQLGDGSSANSNYGDYNGEIPLNRPDVDVGATVNAIAAAGHHTCALLSDSQLKCWGLNNYGQLGYGNTIERTLPPANGVDLDGVTAYQLTAGTVHTCALRSNGTARCWGRGLSGRLGSGSTGNILTPAAADDIQIFAP